MKRLSNGDVGKRIDTFFETRLGQVIWIGLNFALMAFIMWFFYFNAQTVIKGFTPSEWAAFYQYKAFLDSESGGKVMGSMSMLIIAFIGVPSCFAFNWLGRWSASNNTKALKKKIALLESQAGSVSA